MGKKHISYYHSLEYAKKLIKDGIETEKASRFAAHRYDEKPSAVMRGLLKEEKKKETFITFYDGPIYFVNVNNKKDVKKSDIAIKLDECTDIDTAKQCIERYYSKKPYRGIIRKSDWDNAKFFSDIKEYNNFVQKK